MTAVRLFLSGLLTGLLIIGFVLTANFIHAVMTKRPWNKAGARTAVLNTLARGEWWYGLDLMRATRVRAGLTYRVLADLEREGLVVAKWAELEPGQKYRRRLYRMGSFT